MTVRSCYRQPPAAGGCPEGVVDSWIDIDSSQQASFPIDGSFGFQPPQAFPGEPSQETYGHDIRAQIKVSEVGCTLANPDYEVPVTIRYTHTATGDQAFEMHVLGATEVASTDPSNLSAAAGPGADIQTIWHSSGTTTTGQTVFLVPLSVLMSTTEIHTHELGQPQFANGEQLTIVGVNINLDGVPGCDCP